MPRYINADDLPVTTVAILPYAMLEKPYNAEVVFAQAIKAAPTADVREVMASSWVPVSKKMPKKGQECLISTNTDIVWTAWFIGDEWHGDECTFSMQEVLAWMPMPKSYKPDEKTT